MALSRYIGCVLDKIIRVNGFPHHHFGGIVVILRAERIPSHGLEGLGEENGVTQRSAVIERHRTDGFETIRPSDLPQRGAIEERLVADGFDAFSQISTGHFGAFLKGIGTDGGYTVRQDDRLQVIASVERIRTDGSEPFGERDSLHIFPLRIAVPATGSQGSPAFNHQMSRAGIERVGQFGTTGALIHGGLALGHYRCQTNNE